MRDWGALPSGDDDLPGRQPGELFRVGGSWVHLTEFAIMLGTPADFVDDLRALEWFTTNGLDGQGYRPIRAPYERRAQIQSSQTSNREA